MLYTQYQVEKLVKMATEMAISQCKNATGLHKKIDTYVSKNQIVHNVMGTDIPKQVFKG